MLSSLTMTLGRRVLLLYPPGWRRRYADEVGVVLDRGLSFRDVVDLVRGSLDAWWTEIAGVSWAPAPTTMVITGYVLLQLIAFVVLRVTAGAGRLDVAAVWALEYGAGYVLLCYVLGRRRSSQPR